MKIRDFKNLISKYKVIFFDAYGVLKNYEGLIPGVEKTLKYLVRSKIDFYILTNDASRSPSELAETYRRLGVEEITEDKIVSSGMLAREYLRYKVKKKATVAYLGTVKSAHYIEAVGLKTLPIRQLDMKKLEGIEALVLLDDEGFDWRENTNKVANLLRAKNMPVIVANSDLAYPVSGQEVAVAIGGIADMVEAVVAKRFIRFGKPDSQMFMFAYEQVLAKKKVAKDEILMVGDTLKTDILGGNKFGIDTALVLSGNTLADQASFLIRTTGIIPDYVCDAAVV